MMLKISVLISSLCLIAYANSADELYKKAGEFEKNGDTKNALFFYKQAAKAALDIKDLSEEPQIDKKQDHSMNFAHTDEPITDFFGLETFHTNYILPETYTKNIPDDGRKKFETKFQISVKKPLVRDILGLDETLYFGYTQRSWWQTSKDSSPFRENNYEPELFVNFPTDILTIPNLKNFQLGVLHNSNGKDGEQSRSWNRVYLRGNFVYDGFSIAPRIWWRIPEHDDDNPDITDYAGNGDVSMFYKFNKHIFSLKLTNNLHLDKTNRGSAELGWMFPLFYAGFYGYVQYFNGYAENLADYDKHTNKIGIGFLFF
ncbi:phospholipase A [Campylobacter hyointestinalis]|uniref:phospholipase A n=1 Tax=Campylobacter hyointestinalis TaxID=198 RepID=UPI0007239ED0|nr:phospholipase A [Campylobacter hyointestinalis]CUU83781.1 phospholipase A [Campylobacter hyointestinalis]